MRKASVYFLTFALVIFCARGSRAQQEPNLERGYKPFGSYQGGDIDSVNLMNGNVVIHKPLRSYQQRGSKLGIDYSFRYNNKGFEISEFCDSFDACTDQWVLPEFGNGVEVIEDHDQIGGSYQLIQSVFNSNDWVVIPYFSTSDGAQHIMGNTGGANYRTLDATGLQASDITSAAPVSYDYNGVRYFGVTSAPNSPPWAVIREDSNGNQILSRSDLTRFQDTLGRILQTPYGASPTNDYSGCDLLPATRAKLYMIWTKERGRKVIAKLCHPHQIHRRQ